MSDSSVIDFDRAASSSGSPAATGIDITPVYPGSVSAPPSPSLVIPTNDDDDDANSNVQNKEIPDASQRPGDGSGSPSLSHAPAPPSDIRIPVVSTGDQPSSQPPLAHSMSPSSLEYTTTTTSITSIIESTTIVGNIITSDTPPSSLQLDTGETRIMPSSFTMDPSAIEDPFMTEPRAATDSPVSYVREGDAELISSVVEEIPSRQQTIIPGQLLGQGHPTTRSRSHVHGRRRFSDNVESRQSSSVMRPSPRTSRSYRSHFLLQGAGHDAAVGAKEETPMGSIRMGTSALVSALTALPWDTEIEDPSSAGDDESDAHTSSASDAHARLTQTSVFPKRPTPSRMHSSLHTIRPRDAAPPMQPASPFSAVPYDDDGPSGSHPRHRRRLFSNHSRHHLDFPYKENAIARRAQAPGATELSYQLGDDHAAQADALLADLPTSPRTQPLEEHADDSEAAEEARAAEAKRRRSARLATRLQEVFGLEEEEEVLEELPCWLLRSVMLKGYIFLTRKRICFFAHMPDHESAVIKSGPLWKKASRTKLSTKFWFTLRNDVLSWYESSNDPYFPKGNVSLQYASSCDSIGGARFKLRTTERNYTFTADTEANAEEWIRVVNKVIFKRQQEGETVRLIIPLEAVVDIELGPSLEFAETIEVKVVDADDSMSIDSYFFASFPDNEYAYELLQNLLDKRPTSQLPKLSSETSPNKPDGDSISEKSSRPTKSVPVPGTAKPAASGAIIPKIGAAVLRPLRLSGESKSESRVPIAAPTRPALPYHSDEPSDADQSGRESGVSDDEGYPPKQTGAPPPGMEQQPQSWRGSWIRNPAAKLFGSSPSSIERKVEGGKRRRRAVQRQPSVTEVLEPAPTTSDDDFTGSESALTLSPKSSDMFSAVLPVSPPLPGEDPMERQFHAFFALPEKEELIAHFSGSLYRVLPVHGRFFISTNYFCFRSSHLLYKTRMLVPIRELYGMKAQKAFRFGHSGLIVIIKGYEELFLEFSSSKRRNECMTLLEDRMTAVREAATPQSGTPSVRETKIMEDLDDMLARSAGPSTSLPSPLFNSAASSLLEFKPEPMKIVCLTIGSRGDVQPYIALCKGLQAEGHTPVIASHGEYRDWVEGHGIGFESIGGDPAALMQLCVDNGMFTVSFLKEGLQKFRAWLDDLLMSSWEACQGAQMLIESPSAMAGIHIAEALRIPYYRAFTMPWTRTRAYPQAFAVPEHKRGGSYNYMTYVMFDQVFWRAISGQINRWRKQALNLDSTTLDKLQQDKVPFLYNFSPTIVPPPLDWTEWIHVTGYWFLDQADNHEKQTTWAPPDGLVEFIDAAHARGQKVVYIGFGSIVVSDPQEMTRCVVEAVVQSGVCAILTKGWSDRGQRKDGADVPKEEKEHSVPTEEQPHKDGADGIQYPDSIYAIDSIDHSWLFPRIDAACHHGGAGTTGASLRAGIPTIIKPFFGDQSFWAERVESLGVGSAIRKLTTDELANALIQATTNERQIAKAKVVGEEIRRERGVQAAIQCIYRDLEYAKSLIKPRPSDESRTRKVSIPILSTASSGTKRVRQSISQVFSGTDKEGHSDESWSVVSDGVASQLSSPHHHSRTPSYASNSADPPGTNDDEASTNSHHSSHHSHHRASEIPGISTLVHLFSRDKNSADGTPERRPSL